MRGLVHCSLRRYEVKEGSEGVRRGTYPLPRLSRWQLGASHGAGVGRGRESGGESGVVGGEWSAAVTRLPLASAKARCVSLASRHQSCAETHSRAHPAWEWATRDPDPALRGARPVETARRSDRGAGMAMAMAAATAERWQGRVFSAFFAAGPVSAGPYTPPRRKTSRLAPDRVRTGVSPKLALFPSPALAFRDRG